MTHRILTMIRKLVADTKYLAKRTGVMDLIAIPALPKMPMK